MQPLDARSTEHNIDLYALFRNLHGYTGNKTYAAASQHALMFLEKVQSSDGRVVLTVVGVVYVCVFVFV